jgi:protein disulfide-isomerase A1
MRLLLLFAVVLALVSSEIISFNQNAIDKIFKDKQTTLFLFTTTGKESEDALATFTQLDETHPEGILLAHSSSEDGHGLYNRLAEFIGVDLTTVPTVVFLGNDGDKYVLEGDYTVEKLREFIGKAESKEVDPFLKSHPIPESND